MWREKLFGLLLGAAAGLLVDASLILLAYVLLAFMAPVVLVPPLVGAGIGLRLARAGRLPRWPWPVAILSGLAACYLAVMLPYGLTVSELRWDARTIPSPAGAVVVETDTGPFGSSMAGPFVRRQFKTSNKQDVAGFYRQRLESEGWRIVRYAPEHAWYGKNGAHLFVTVHPQPGKIEVTYHPAWVFVPWVMLFAGLAGFIYLGYRARRRNG